ncbi:hypothetical protein RRG08_044955 [Elysia crispata]|uniref:Uncharacterized protein n=1 Tax=Elysia crispata TaxID=231223 RepID=A0AAE0ZTI6_9GAST|nr:hypothetical protein RRG08_044955 [Elysia crispata]
MSHLRNPINFSGSKLTVCGLTSRPSRRDLRRVLLLAMKSWVAQVTWNLRTLLSIPRRLDGISEHYCCSVAGYMESQNITADPSQVRGILRTLLSIPRRLEVTWNLRTLLLIPRRLDCISEHYCRSLAGYMESQNITVDPSQVRWNLRTLLSILRRLDGISEFSVDPSQKTQTWRHTDISKQAGDKITIMATRRTNQSTAQFTNCQS